MVTIQTMTDFYDYRSITRARRCWSCPNICAVTGDLVKDTQLREEISRHSLARKESNQDKEQSGQLDPVCPVVISSKQENREEQLNENKRAEECEPLQLVVASTEQVVVATTDGVSPCSEDSFVENVDLKSKTAKTEKSVIKPSDISKEVETVTTLPTSSRIEIHVEEDASHLKPSEVLPEDSIDSGTNISDPVPVQKNIEEEVNPPTVNLVKDYIETDLQIDEVAQVHPEDKAISNTIVPDRADLCTEELKKDNSKLLCDYNIPGGSEGTIHSKENSSSKPNFPVKICLKGNFEKLSEKVKLFDIPKYQSEADLEMFEKNLSTHANDSDQNTANAEEVRIVKMVEDLDKKEKIVRIIEELDKTKSLTKRRKSGEATRPEKRASPLKPVEAAPITNALQGLQALLKMSKMTEPNSSSTKETDSNSSEKKSGRSRNSSGTSSKSSHGDHHEVRSRRNSGSHEHKSRKGESKSRHGDHKSRHSDPPSLTRINRSALVRDRQVETHSKSLVEEQNNKKNVVEDLQAVSNTTKSGHHDYYESKRSRNKFQSFQMKDIRKRLLPGSSSVNTISSRASEVAKRKGKEEDEEVKVLSYRMVKPKIEEDNHERIIRKVEDPSSVQKTVKYKAESASKLNSLEGVVDKVSRKVTEVPKVMEVMHDDIPVEEELKGSVKPGQSSQTKSEATLNLFQKSIVKIQSQENTDNLKTQPERRKSLDLIKEELERVTSKVNDIKNKSSREISSDDDMKVIMKDVQEMERDVNDISQDAENGRRSKSKKKKHKDEKKKKKKEKYTGDIAIDSRIAKKIISRIISSDMGKSFNEVIKREVGETESTIEKLREDLRKKSSQENKSKKKNKKDKSREGKEKKKKKKDRHGDEENPRDEAIKKKKRSKERSASRPAVAEQVNERIEENVSDKISLSKVESSKIDKSPDMNSKKRKSSSPVRFYDQVPEVAAPETSKELPYDTEGKKAKKIKSDERRDHKKKKSKKKHKRNKEKQEKDGSVGTVGNNLVDNQASAFVESKTENKERIVRKRSSSPGKDFELVLGVAEEDLLDETVLSHATKTDILSDSVTETEVDTTIDENDCNDTATDISTSVIDAALEDIPTRESPADANISNTNSGATSSANSEDEQSEDEDNLRALLLSQLSKTRCGPKAKSKKRSSNLSKAPNSKITKISWSSPHPEPVEVSSTTPAVPATSTPSYPPMGSLPVYAYAYSRTFITPAEKLLYFPNLYNRILVPLDLDSDSDSDCHSDCDSFWGEKRTSQWVSERMSYSESDPRFSQANLNLVMRSRDSCSPAPL